MSILLFSFVEVTGPLDGNLLFKKQERRTGRPSRRPVGAASGMIYRWRGHDLRGRVDHRKDL
ncbi:hypothetical protein M2267_004739 [Ensifer sp. KUDG1]|uniref:hypothetical protein n=1 Tax=Ensifer sp. KUDG1 TaxID=3373919 RepID=UPI003D1BC273